MTLLRPFAASAPADLALTRFIRRGRGAQPIQIRLRAPLDSESYDFRRRVAMKLFDSAFELGISCVGCLDDQQSFDVPGNFAFPPIHRLDAGNYVYAGSQLLGYQGIRQPCGFPGVRTGDEYY